MKDDLFMFGGIVVVIYVVYKVIAGKFNAAGGWTEVASGLTSNSNSQVQQDRLNLIAQINSVPDYVVIPGASIPGVTDPGNTTAGELRTAGYTDEQINQMLVNWVNATNPPDTAWNAWVALLGGEPSLASPNTYPDLSGDPWSWGMP